MRPNLLLKFKRKNAKSAKIFEHFLKNIFRGSKKGDFLEGQKGSKNRFKKRFSDLTCPFCPSQASDLRKHRFWEMPKMTKTS